MVDEERLGEWGHSILLTHGVRTEKVHLLLHGLTASPPQFAEFGRRLFERGANVMIPRLPRHGLEDRMTPILAELRIGELVEFARASVAAARQQGERVVVSGFSLGGLLATWIGQHERVERIVAIAPFFGVSWLSDGLAPWLFKLTLTIPNRFIYWHPFERERLLPEHGYPRYPTHAVARAYHLARDVYHEARVTPPRTKDLVLVVNDSEVSVSNRSIARLSRAWSRHDGVNLTVHHLRGLPPSHDIIEPLRVPQIVERVYPELLDLADR